MSVPSGELHSAHKIKVPPLYPPQLKIAPLASWRKTSFEVCCLLVCLVVGPLMKVIQLLRHLCVQSCNHSMALSPSLQVTS